ncbi:hypothetical protein ACFT9M_29420 [Micromonospora purpureochromogenes]|uniref:hypothetical protein n=1 Tax=Micromonospora purpureochromogenes TaxID=47872 RepID=UPI0036403FB0
MTDGENHPQRLIDRIDEALGTGYLGPKQAQAAAAAVPELPDALLPLLRQFAASGDLRRFERYAVAATHLHPDGLGEIICDVLDAGDVGVNGEELVDILGEIRYLRGVPSIIGFMNRRLPSDRPYFTTAIKCVSCLGEIGSDEARKALRELTGPELPDPVRWHAAVELGMEDELGFDEDEMLNFP